MTGSDPAQITFQGLLIILWRRKLLLVTALIILWVPVSVWLLSSPDRVSVHMLIRTGLIPEYEPSLAMGLPPKGQPVLPLTTTMQHLRRLRAANIADQGESLPGNDEASRGAWAAMSFSDIKTTQISIRTSVPLGDRSRAEEVLSSVLEEIRNEQEPFLMQRRAHLESYLQQMEVTMATLEKDYDSLTSRFPDSLESNPNLAAVLALEMASFRRWQASAAQSVLGAKIALDTISPAIILDTSTEGSASRWDSRATLILASFFLAASLAVGLVMAVETAASTRAAMKAGGTQ